MKSKVVMIVLAVVLVVSVVFVGCAKPAAAPGPEGYPERPISVLIGYGAGGGTDRFARAIGTPLSKIMGQSLVYVLLPGGAASIAEDYLLKQPADGYTILAMGGDLPINLTTERNTHSMDDYIPLCRVQHDTDCIQINAKDTRFSNLDEFVAYAKENRVTIGTGGAAGIDEVVAAMFIRATGIKAECVPYDKTGQMRAAVVAGDIDACTEEFGPAVSLIESGDMKPIIAFADERAEDFPDCPTAVENGWDITLGRARGVVMPAGTPEPILEFLESAIYQAYETDEYKTFERESYLHLRPGWASREEYTQQLLDELDMYSELLAELGYI